MASATDNVTDRVTDMMRWFRWLYFQWCIHTTACMLEPWEARILNIVAVAVLLGALYTSYVFLPAHIQMLITFIRVMFSGGSSSDPASMADSVHHQEM